MIPFSIDEILRIVAMMMNVGDYCDNDDDEC
jgi:hypothetical protein